MKMQQSLPLVLAVLVAGTGGYVWGRFGNAASLPTAESRPVPATRKSATAPSQGFSLDGGVLSKELADLLGGPPGTGKSAGEATLRALSEPNPARRSAAIGILLDSMTVENAGAIKQAFVDITSRTGRRHDSEWVLMLKQYGHTLGKEAVDQLKGNLKDRAHAMEGWAMADPEAARLSLDPADPEFLEMRMAMLYGATGKDPATGFRMALLEPQSPFYPEWMVQCGIQSRGMEGTTAALQEVLDTSSPDLAHTPAFGMLFGALADAMFFQHWTGGQSEKMLPWLEQQKDQPFVTEQMIDHGAKDAVLQGKLTETLDWLDRMGGGERGPYAGSGGLTNALMLQPALLEGMDDGTFDRMISKLPMDGRTHAMLADAMEPVNAAQAARLRAAGGSTP